MAKVKFVIYLTSTCNSWNEAAIVDHLMGAKGAIGFREMRCEDKTGVGKFFLNIKAAWEGNSDQAAFSQQRTFCKVGQTLYPLLCWLLDVPSLS